MKILSKLASTYQLKCSQGRKDVNSFYPDIYTKALEDVLDTFYEEDAREHGVLIELKDILLIRTAGGRQLHQNPVARLFFHKDLQILKSRKEIEKKDQIELEDEILEASQRLEEEKEEDSLE